VAQDEWQIATLECRIVSSVRVHCAGLVSGNGSGLCRSAALQPIVERGFPGSTSSGKTTSSAAAVLSAPGTYQADVLLDDEPVWRGFLRITI
jgi:hypothetical protein